MRFKKRNTNLQILQASLRNLALNEQPEVKEQIKEEKPNKELEGSGVLELKVKPKKKGMKKNELINTKRLLTM